MKQITCYALLLLAIGGCKKDSIEYTPLASVNIVNASVNLSSAKANFTGPNAPNYYAQITATIGYGANTVYSIPANTGLPLTIVSNADTTKPLFSASLDYAPGASYSLYLAGQATAVDTLVVKESLPKFTDSSCAVRFINLSYNSNPIKITLSTTPTVNEVASLGYKQASDFKTYPAGTANNTCSFQVRDAGTSAILATYTLTVPRFFGCTLAWIGQTGASGTNAPKIIRVNNY